MRHSLGLPLFLLLENFSNWLVFISVLTFAGYELNASATEVALVTVSMLAPQALLGRMFQKVARHWPSRPVLAVVTATQIGLALSLMVAHSTLALCVILLMRSFVHGFFQPAFAAVASQHPSPRLASQVSLIQSVSRIVAPALGGVASSMFGEGSVFAMSAILAALALPFVWSLPETNPARSDSENGDAVESTGGAIPWLILVFPILFVSGASNMFSNLIPFAFSFYELPKTLLAFAISCSALGGLLTNLIFLKYPITTDSYPARVIWLAWLGNASLFLALALMLPVAHLAIYAVPVIFCLLSGTRVLFTVSLNGYIYNQSRERAVTLASQQQSLMAITGIGATFTGATAMELISPALTLSILSGFAIVASFAWLYRMLSSGTAATATPPPRTQPTAPR